MTADRPMQLGMIGLGRMGSNLVRRLMRDGHHCVAYDRNPDVVKSLETEGATGANSYEEFVQKLDRPRNIWIMIPAGAVQSALDALVTLLEPDDMVIDGGNSYYRDDITRGEALRRRHPLRRRRHQRRGVGARTRLLPDDWRPDRGRAAARPHLQDDRPRRPAAPSPPRAEPGPTAPLRTVTCTAARTARGTS